MFVETSNKIPRTSQSTPKLSDATSLFNWKTILSPATGEPAIVTAVEYAVTWTSLSAIYVSVTEIAVPNAVSSASSSLNALPAKFNEMVCDADPPVQVQYTLYLIVPASQFAGVLQLN